MMQRKFGEVELVASLTAEAAARMPKENFGTWRGAAVLLGCDVTFNTATMQWEAWRALPASEQSDSFDTKGSSGR